MLDWTVGVDVLDDPIQTQTNFYSYIIKIKRPLDTERSFLYSLYFIKLHTVFICLNEPVFRISQYYTKIRTYNFHTFSQSKTFSIFLGYNNSSLLIYFSYNSDYIFHFSSTKFICVDIL